MLREILEWGQGIRTGSDSIGGDQPDPLTVNKVVQSALRKESEGGDIIVAVFPEGTLERLPNGTTVAKVIRDKVRGMSRSCFLLNDEAFFQVQKCLHHLPHSRK